MLTLGKSTYALDPKSDVGNIVPISKTLVSFERCLKHLHPSRHGDFLTIGLYVGEYESTQIYIILLMDLLFDSNNCLRGGCRMFV